MKRKRSRAVAQEPGSRARTPERVPPDPSSGPDAERLPAGLRRTLGLCFFFSGAATLVLEVVWSKVLGHVLGNSTQAVGTVVAAFMAGLALGSALAARLSRRITDPLRFYVRIEAALALCAVASVPLFRATTPLFQVVHRALGAGGLDGHTGFLLVRFLLVFLLMLAPVTLMGMTLPVMVGVFGRRRHSYDREAGQLYGLNTLGAVAGTLAAGFLLIPALGLFGAACAAGALQLGIAGLASRQRRRLGAQGAAPDAAMSSAVERVPAWTAAQWLIAGAFALSGALAMLYEVAWFRLLALVTGPSVGAFATLLALFLLAVGAGSLAASARAQRMARPLGGMGLAQAIVGFSVLFGLTFYDRLPGLYAALVTGAGQAGAQLLVAAVTLGLPCLAMGAQFPLAVRALSAAGPRQAPERNVGRLYLANTVGGIAGSLAGAFWALPGAGLHATFARASLVSVLLGLLLALAAWGRRALRPAVAGLLAAVALVTFAPALDTGALNQGRYLQRTSDADEQPQLLYHREGVATSVSVFRTEGHVDLRVAGKVDASNSPGDLRTQQFVGALPTLLARDPRRVAVIGYGSGMSVGAALQHPRVASVDVLEIEPAVVEASDFFSGINGRPLQDPRARLVLEDGRTHLTYTGQTYDVIASEPSNPWIAGVADLFTTDFYRIARARLAPGGVFGQWIQLYALSDDVFETMLASLQEVFPHVALFLPEPTDLVAIASAEPLALDWNLLRERFAAPAVRAGFAELGLRNPAHLLAHLAAGPGQTRELVAGVRRRNTDDNTWLERRLGREFVALRSQRVTAPLGARLLRERLPAMRELFPGLPALEVAREIVHYLRDQEPRLRGAEEVYDEWAEARRGIGAGLVAALREEGDLEAAGALQEIVARAEEDWQKREEATRLVLRATLGGGGQVRAAVARALELAPDLPAALWMAAELSAGADDGAAEAHLRRALEYPWHRVHTDVVTSLATLCARRGRVEEALALLSELIGRNPYWVRPQVLQVGLLRQLQRLDDARSALGEALRHNPGSPELLALVEALGAR